MKGVPSGRRGRTVPLFWTRCEHVHVRSSSTSCLVRSKREVLYILSFVENRHNRAAHPCALSRYTVHTPSHLASYQPYLRSVSYQPENDVSLSVSVLQVLEDCSEAECLAAEGAARAGCLVPAESIDMYPVVFRFDEILQEKGCGDTTA